ncbi:hypothetical protein [Protaetiibacter mangrovi]|uniref:Benenodin family lasso peptide n=1 Tax=Protaetiibacter mangrovi TaxID=2970926 RepID=A0ABT1ZBL6_9MICO|nr:hypothetical protein [Protaetiibacter mangrovi]MCS0498088.1 hypothetical protein [Protaetiibacter mangrovi]
MLKTNDIDLRALFDELEEPLILLAEVADGDQPDDGFDGVCTQHDGCRII